MPKVINTLKPFETKQDYKESRTEFLNRLKETAQKYTNIDPDLENWEIEFLLDTGARCSLLNTVQGKLSCDSVTVDSVTVIGATGNCKT